MKKIGILFGMEDTYPQAFIDRVNSKNEKVQKIENTQKDSSDSEELTPPEIIYQQSKILNNDLKDELLNLIKNNSQNSKVRKNCTRH